MSIPNGKGCDTLQPGDRKEFNACPAAGGDAPVRVANDERSSGVKKSRWALSNLRRRLRLKRFKSDGSQSRSSVGHKYPLKPTHIRTLSVLGEHPGVTAIVFAELMWPGKLATNRHLERKARKVLHLLMNMCLVKFRVEPTDFLKPGRSPEPPRCVYYLTGLGFEANEYWQRYKARHASHDN